MYHQLVRNLNLKYINAKRRFKAWFRSHWEFMELHDTSQMSFTTEEWLESLEEAYLAGYKSGQRKDSKQGKNTVNK